MPTPCMNSYPEFEQWTCYGCHLSQPRTSLVQDYKNSSTGVIDKANRKSTISVCLDFAVRLYGQNDLKSPTTKYDDCGLVVNNTVIIPSNYYGSALEMFNDPALKPGLFREFTIQFIDTKTTSPLLCFNGAAA
jgi:hypothetical protein